MASRSEESMSGWSISPTPAGRTLLQRFPIRHRDARRPRPRDVGVFLSGKGLVAKVAMCVYEYHGVKDSENKPNYKTL